MWWAQADDTRRPVLILTRGDAIAVLNRIVVAPVTRTVVASRPRSGSGPDDGLPAECAASFDNLQPINRRRLTERIAVLDAARRHEICAALAALADC